MTNNVFNAAWPITYGGTGTTDGSVLVPNGDATTPGVRFQSEPTTGFYRVSAGVVGLSVLGVGAVRWSATAYSPVTSDGNALGTASLMWSDLFLAPGAVINWNNGDVTETHSTNLLAWAGASNGYSYADGGIFTATATGGNKGAATINTSAYYTDGVNTTITPWVAYTPTFTGFGTATNINFRSRKVGNTLEVMGTFTPGTTTATEARITLGFNGTSANVSVDSTLGVRTAVGSIAFNTAFAGSGVVLIEASQTFMCFGIESASPALSSYAKALGNSFISSVTLSFTALVPLS